MTPAPPGTRDRQAGGPPAWPPPAPPARRIWAERILQAEPLILLALAPFVWFPRSWNLPLLLLVPAFWVLRRALHGRWSVRTPYDRATIALLFCLPLFLAPVVDWAAAGPRLLALLYGIALMYALTNAAATPRRLGAVVLGSVILVAGGLSLVGLIGTEWSSGKLLPLEPLYARLPLLIRGIVPNQPQGGLHPNEIAGALLLLWPLALVAAAPRRLPRRAGLAPVRQHGGPARGIAGRLLVLDRPLTRGVAILSTGVLALTQSRSAYIGAAIAVLLILGWRLFERAKSPRSRLLGGGGVILAAGAGAWLVWRLISGWLAGAGTISGTLDTLPSRLELWERALLIIRDFPLTGIGLGQISPVLRALYPLFLSAPDIVVPHVHNFFLQLAAEMGLPAALAFGGLVVACYRVTWRVGRRGANAAGRGLAIGLSAGLTAFLVFGLTDAVMPAARGGLPIWIVLGLAGALDRVSRCPRLPAHVYPPD